MKRTALLAASVLLALSGATAFAADSVPKAIADAVADKGRPEADTKRDADRKPAEVVAFAGIKPGDTVVDIMPGGGYFTRIFAKAVGPKGKVIAVVPEEMMKTRATAADGVKAIAADPAYANVIGVETPSINAIKISAPADVIWTSQNYHDFKNKMFGPADISAMNKSILAALKPGGTYIVLDHVAAAGAANATEELHRIDPAVVKAEVTAAGFKFDSESKVLAHSADDHTGKVFDAGMRGKTDQFIYKFKK